MTFEEIVKQIPYFKEHPEQYTRDRWWFFPEDEKEYLEAIDKFIKKHSPSKKRSIEVKKWVDYIYASQQSSTIDPFKQLSDKDGVEPWIKYLCKGVRE